MRIKLMSFNTQHCMNFITRKIDYDVMADAIKKCDADIIALNEMRGEGPANEFEAQTEMLAEKAGYEYYSFAPAILVGGKNPYGNGMLSKYPIKSVGVVSIPEPEIHKYNDLYEDRCLLKAVVDINGEELSVYVTHFGLNPDEAENSVKEILSEPIPEKLVLMGDFNHTPDSDIIKPLKEHLSDAADLFDEEKLTYPSDVPIKKIDYIFTSKNIKILSADIPVIIASDHRPHTAVIEI